MLRSLSVVIMAYYLMLCHMQNPETLPHPLLQIKSRIFPVHLNIVSDVPCVMNSRCPEFNSCSPALAAWLQPISACTVLNRTRREELHRVQNQSTQNLCTARSQKTHHNRKHTNLNHSGKDSTRPAHLLN